MKEQELRFDVIAYNESPSLSKASIIAKRTKDFDLMNADMLKVGEITVFGDKTPIFLAKKGNLFCDSLNNYIWDSKPTVYEIVSLICIAGNV